MSCAEYYYERARQLLEKIEKEEPVVLDAEDTAFITEIVKRFYYSNLISAMME